MACLARGVLVLGSGGRIPLAEGRVLRPPPPPPVTFLSRPDGTATANLAEMDGLLQDV